MREEAPKCDATALSEALLSPVSGGREFDDASMIPGVPHGNDMRGILRRCCVIAMAVLGGSSTASCGCPTIAGPTAPVAWVSVTLAPGEFRYLDADTPKETTQINLRFNASSVTATLRVRQVDPACLPTAADNCPAFSEQDLPARPAGVTNSALT